MTTVTLYDGVEKTLKHSSNQNVGTVNIAERLNKEKVVKFCDLKKENI